MCIQVSHLGKNIKHGSARFRSIALIPLQLSVRSWWFVEVDSLLSSNYKPLTFKNQAKKLGADAVMTDSPVSLREVGGVSSAKITCPLPGDCCHHHVCTHSSAEEILPSKGDLPLLFIDNMFFETEA